MTPNIEKPKLNSIEQQIISEEEKYQRAFKADAEFQVLKDIRQTINHLKLKLVAQPTIKQTSDKVNAQPL